MIERLNLVLLFNALMFLFPSIEVSASKTSAEQLYMGISPHAQPELAKPGTHIVGVQTLSITNPKQFNLATQAFEDRELTIEVWYPASAKKKSAAYYEDVTRSRKPFKIKANAYRDAKIAKGEKFPFVVMSHGYTGYRTIMFYLGEHLASHGYVVASIDHTDSTNAEVDFKASPFSGFPSTLLNRSRDQQFVLNYFSDNKNPFSNILDTKNSGLIGFSMGGYGAISTIGGCYGFSPSSIGRFTGIKDEATLSKLVYTLNSCAGGQYENPTVDKKWKAAVALAPWGYEHFDSKSLSKISVPSLLIAGDQDDISGYKNIRSFFEKIGSPSSYLLTYKNARHNVAPHPAPKAAQGIEFDFGQYWDATWNIEQINAVNEHFVLGMMNCHVKQQKSACGYLDLTKDSNQKHDGQKLSPAWKGFPDRYATGLQWESKK